MSVSDASRCAERKMPPPLPSGALLPLNVLFLTTRLHPDGRHTEREAPDVEDEYEEEEDDDDDDDDEEDEEYDDDDEERDGD